jgi:bifunctional non-homologous end joining protein LigD
MAKPDDLKEPASLRDYRRKRDFARTPEPAGSTRRPGKSRRPSFVIQKHAARQTHYDFRLEVDGVLKSWAVPKGPSLDPSTKRLAVHVEDHPIEYGDFEGVIPRGEYGGGTVMVWDRGYWEPYGDAVAGYAKGDLKFILHGTKLHGRWVLVRMKRRESEKTENWLLIKERDEAAQPGTGDAIIERETRSVTTGRDMDAIAAAADRVWSSKAGGETPAPAQRSGKRTRTTEPSIDPSKVAGAKRARAPATLAPQLAMAAGTAPNGDDWLHEIKFDGYRILAHVHGGAARLRSRTALDWTDKFPELAQTLAALPVSQAVLDGEVAHVGVSGVTDFGALQDAVAARRTAQLVYMAFDLLFLDGWDLTDAPLEARKALLEALLARAETPAIRFSDHHVGRGPDFFAAACGLGLEGIVSKRRDARYRAGRGPTWLKVKNLEREDFVVVGFTDPEGERVGFGALLVGYHTPEGKLVYAGRVGTGYSTKALERLRERLGTLERKRPTVTLPADLSARGVHWVKPDLVVEVGFSAWTRDRVLRAASFIGIRDDTSSADVVIEPADNGRQPKLAPASAPIIGRDGAATVGGVRITHAERIVYPDGGASKLAVAEYYAAVADWILPHVAGRPLSLLRCPDGVEGQRFFQKHPWASVSDAIKQVAVPWKGTSETYLTIEDVRGLLGLVQMGVLEIHPWGSTIADLERPDRLIFDLDPDEGLGWDRVIETATAVRDLLKDLGLRSFVKTTGGKGLHVVAPVRPQLDWDAAKAFCRAVATTLAAGAPQRYTASMSKAARRGRVFIDYLRNGRGATAVAAYSTRARARATVSAPLSWDEVENGVRADHFTLETLPQRLRAAADPWADFLSVRQSISPAVRRKLGV